MAKEALFFSGVKIADNDPEGAFLRASVYRDGPTRHARFSVWVGDEARCVISIPESEAKDLAGFIQSSFDNLKESEVVVPLA